MKRRTALLSAAAALAAVVGAAATKPAVHQITGWIIR